MIFHPVVRRVANSTVAWSWAFNFLRLASGVLLLPLLLRMLSKADLGMYWEFLSLNAIVVMLDVGFSPTVGRFISYAMGGAKRLSAMGLSAEPPHGEPNYPLLWELLFTSRIFYRYVALGIVLLLATVGSVIIGKIVGETSSPALTWMAWGVSIAAVAADTYFNVWNIFLRNLNKVLVATQISTVAYALRVGIACVLLAYGWGLLSLPVASLLTSLVIRNFSRALCLKALMACPPPGRVEWRAHLRTIWPNSWRLGLYFAGAYLSANANVLLCSSVFGLEANATYGLSLQVIRIATGMAGVWVLVKWPLIGQYAARSDISAIERVLWPRLWLQQASYVALAIGAITTGPFLIHYFGKDKDMLSFLWMALLAANGFLEAHCSVWNTLISMWNKLPMLWASLATNAAAFYLNLVLVGLPHSHPGLLVLGPLLAGILLNYWYWPRYGARTIGTTWIQFVRHGWTLHKRETQLCVPR